ncbi:MAG: cupredoxin domain-containing protein [Anaerolineales bacterium]|nr:cupredoxin domain-containing protein [Anaerolineales bacterium]
MFGNLISFLVLIAFVVLFGWLTFRIWKAKRWFIKWPGLVLSVLLSLTLLLTARGSDDGSITIKTDGMSFVMDEVHVKAGQPVTLHVVNQDGYAHAFDIDEFDIHAPLPANETFDAAFTPAEPGRYTFYCGSPGHAAAGMEGVLVVEP